MYCRNCGKEIQETQPTPNLGATTAQLSTSHIWLNSAENGPREFYIYLNCPGYTFQDDECINGISSSNKNVRVGVESVAGYVIRAEVRGTGTTNLTLLLCGPEYYKYNDEYQVNIGTLTREALTVHNEGEGVVIKKKGTYQLNLECQSGSIRNSDMQWSSSNPKVATEDANGLDRGRKAGNALITGTAPGVQKVACVVSVVTPKQAKILKKAKKIVKTSKYSQAKRMRKGYYDCSALVWKAYKSVGKKLVSKSYAPSAAEQYRYLEKHHKSLGRLTRKNINKLKFRVGDLCYKTDGYTKRYKHIYHVEMCSGYQTYVGSDGKVSIYVDGIRSMPGGSSTYAARP